MAKFKVIRPESARTTTQQVTLAPEPETAPEGVIYNLLRIMRPHHWIKNLVVFGAAIFSGHLDGGSLGVAAQAFLAFCFIASTIYIINDIFDLAADRKHPVKQHRPLAAGKVAIWQVGLLALCLLPSGLLLAWNVGSAFMSVAVAYTLLQVAYNLLLKKQPILDIMAIAMGFVLRALGGAYAIGVTASSWFILCVWLLALYLGIEKRNAELKSLGNQASTRKVLSFYSLPWLLRMEGVATASILMSYSLWAVQEAQSQWMLLSIPFVIYGLFKYQYLTEQGAGETPEKTLVKSPGMIINIILWGITCVAVVLFKP